MSNIESQRSGAVRYRDEWGREVSSLKETAGPAMTEEPLWHAATMTLQWLVTAARFQAVPRVHVDAPLVLLRHWTAGVTDRLLICTEDDVEAQRLYEQEHPERTTSVRPVWRDRNTLQQVVVALQELGPPNPASSVVRLGSSERLRERCAVNELPKRRPGEMIPQWPSSWGWWFVPSEEWPDTEQGSLTTDRGYAASTRGLQDGSER